MEREERIVSTLLEKALAQCFEVSDDTVFTSDADFLDYGIILYDLHAAAWEANVSLQRAISSADDAQIERKRVVINNLSSLIITAEAKCTQRINATVKALEEGRVDGDPKPYVPRLVRLANRLSLSLKEIKALQFLVVYHLGHRGNKAFEERGVLPNTALFAGFRGPEVLAFLAADRPHIEQVTSLTAFLLTPSVPLYSTRAVRTEPHRCQ